MKKDLSTRVILIAVFTLVCGFYLQFSVRYWLETRKLNAMDEETRIEYLRENGARIQALRERIITLGLDLQGGMHVTLELDTPQLLIELTQGSADSEFREVLAAADERADANRTNLVDEFVTEFTTRDPNARLSRYFRSDADNITRRSTNEEVVAYLKMQQTSAMDRAVEIVRTRVDRFGVTEPSILKQGSNRIITELPGVDDEQRVRNLLKGTARLEFRTTPEPSELTTALQSIVNQYQPAAGDSGAVSPLLEVFQPIGQGVVMGYASALDTARVRELLLASTVVRYWPRETHLLWTSRAETTGDDGTGIFGLIAVRSTAELTGEAIIEARPAFNPETNAPEVSMTMNPEAARVWSRITGANINRAVAIVLDNAVVTYPNVISRISDGRSQITGLGSQAEADDLVNILMSGALPAPLEIVEERTVGPSLGAASVTAGFNSAVAGLILVAIFMVLYYQVGGGIAVIALFSNIFFVLGMLAAFNATLTLPGIAGIVLTIGMAVDANVLIFDRIREEMRGGKTMLAAIDSGYRNAMSAIIDSNVTTFLTAVILFSFGVGPIKGFAVTLMIGIAASLFSAIVITRVILDYLTRDRSRAISFG
jgi:preprotein translocase subunit SecD